MKRLQFSLSDEAVLRVKAGDIVLAEGVVFTARDQAHKRMTELLRKGRRLPFSLAGSTIFYCGPTFRNSRITSCGPTTASRMDDFAILLLEKGVKAMIGKGRRSQEVVRACKNYKAVYFAAPAGCASLLCQNVINYERVGFEDLGPEAVYKFTIKDFPLITIIDARGTYLYSKK